MYKYNTIAQVASFEFKDRGSKFIAFAYPIKQSEELKQYIKSLKELHPKASHHCYAYRLGLDKFNYRAVDDGEPSGSAGKPILGAIDSLQLTNVLVVVVRYFGGTLLGVSGLINAYKSSAIEAMKLGGFIEKEITTNYNCEFNYELMGAFNQILNRNRIELISIVNGLFCSVTIAVPMSKAAAVLMDLEEIVGMRVLQNDANQSEVN